jgi:hypothetical protein
MARQAEGPNRMSTGGHFRIRMRGERAGVERSHGGPPSGSTGLPSL